MHNTRSLLVIDATNVTVTKTTLPAPAYSAEVTTSAAKTGSAGYSAKENNWGGRSCQGIELAEG